MDQVVRTALFALAAVIGGAPAMAQETMPAPDAEAVQEASQSIAAEPSAAAPAMPLPPELPMPPSAEAAPPTETPSAGVVDSAPSPYRQRARSSNFSFRRYNLLTVRSEDAEQFYYIRQDNYRALGATDDERLRKLRDLPSFGPNPVGGAYSVYLGENYLFLPVCEGRLDRNKGKLNRLDGPNGSVTLTCR